MPPSISLVLGLLFAGTFICMIGVGLLSMPN